MHVSVREIAAGFVFIHSREHVSSTGHANSGRVVVFIKRNPVTGKLVHVGRLDILVPIATDRVRTLIVREQEHDIWFVRFFVGQ